MTNNQKFLRQQSAKYLAEQTFGRDKDPYEYLNTYSPGWYDKLEKIIELRRLSIFQMFYKLAESQIVLACELAAILYAGLLPLNLLLEIRSFVDIVLVVLSSLFLAAIGITIYKSKLTIQKKVSRLAFFGSIFIAALTILESALLSTALSNTLKEFEPLVGVFFAVTVPVSLYTVLRGGLFIVLSQLLGNSKLPWFKVFYRALIYVSTGIYILLSVIVLLQIARQLRPGGELINENTLNKLAYFTLLAINIISGGKELLTKTSLSRIRF